MSRQVSRLVRMSLSRRNSLSKETGLSEVQLKRSLGVPGLVMFGIAYLVPMTIFTTYGIVNEITGGFLATAYVITLLAVGFTAVSYAVMSNRVEQTGSAYAFATAGLGGRIGFVTGWTVLLDYVLLPMLNYLVIGIYLNAQFPAVPGWVFALLALVAVTALNIVGITAVKFANVVFVGLQILFFIVFFIIAFRSFNTGVGPLSPFIGEGFDLSAVVAGSAILCLSFLGFDAITTMSEEAHNPRRSIPTAVIVTTLSAGVFFIAVSWVAHMAYPHVITGEGAESAAFAMLGDIGGAAVTGLFVATYVTGALGSALTSQASVARILYAMGRDGLLMKKVFGRLSPKFLTPVGAIVTVGIISLTAVVASVDFVASIVSFGALAAFSVVNLSVIALGVRDRRNRTPRRGALALYVIVPAVGLVFTLWLWFSLSLIALVIGIVWVCAGIAYMLFVTGVKKAPLPSLTEAAG